MSRMATAIVAGLAFAGTQVLAGEQDFTLANQTGVEIHEIYISPSDTEEWGEDVLELDVLEDGKSAHIVFAPEEEAEDWDIMVKDEEGNSIVWTELDLTEISKVTLTYNDETPEATVE